MNDKINEEEIEPSEKLALQIASVYYIGYFPVASGTVASFLALLVFYLGLWLFSVPKIGFVIYLIITGLLIIVGTWSADKSEVFLKEKDSHKIVIDEIAGYFLSMIFIPLKTVGFGTLLLVFFVFRIFDVVKPYPIRGLQKYRGGFGIMIDDLVAGIYSSLVVVILRWIF